MTAPEQPAVPHKAAALLVAAARGNPIVREAAVQVQDALIALEQERDAGAVPDTGRPTADEALALVDDLLAAHRVSYRQPEGIHEGWTAGVSVRGDVADEWIRRRVAIADRLAQAVPSPDTGQPAAPGSARAHIEALIEWCERDSPDGAEFFRHDGYVLTVADLRAAAAALTGAPDTGQDRAAFLAAAERIAELWRAPIVPGGAIDHVRSKTWDWHELREALDSLASASPSPDTGQAREPDDACEACHGGGVIPNPGYYVPGEQFVEPPSEDHCWQCYGSGSTKFRDGWNAALRERTAAVPGGTVQAPDVAELERLRKVAEQARVYLSTTEGFAVTFPEGLARASLVAMLDELAEVGRGGIRGE
jgi:hypothetical protein